MGSFGNYFAKTDTVFVPDTFLYLLKFPSAINDIWYSHEYNNPAPEIIKRQWLGYKTISTSVGRFNCIKLQMFCDEDHNNQPDFGQAIIYQYFSNKGLVQEKWIQDINFGNGIAKLTRVTKLVKVNF